MQDSFDKNLNKMSSKTFLLSILLMVLTLSAFISKVHAQSDVLREIKNDFIERKGDWKSGNKYNFFH